MPSGPPIRVLVIAAFPAFRAGLRALLEERPGFVVAGSGESAAGAEDAGPADVLVIDPEGLADVDEILAGYPSAPPVILAGPGEAAVPAGGPYALLHRSATGDELAAAVWAVAQGLIVHDPSTVPPGLAPGRLFDARDAGEPLTGRELDVLGQLALGLPNKAIALNLGISEHTVKFHVSAVLAKLGAASRTEAAMVAARRGLLPL